MQYADVDSSTLDYARRFSGSLGAWLLERQSEVLLQLLTTVRGQQTSSYALLDVGGGHGQIARVFSEKRQPSLTVLGSDSTCSLLLRDLIDSNRVRFEAGDLLQSPFADQSFDVVTCIRLLPHCDEWRMLIRELCRLSKDAVVVDYPPVVSSNVMYPLLFSLKRAAEGNTRTFRIFAHREIDEAFAANGFRRVERVGQFFWPMVLHRVLKSPFLSSLLEKPARALGLQRLLGNPTMALYRRS